MESMDKINIRHFKLTSGEEIIGYVIDSDEQAFVIERPAVVQVSPVGMYTFGHWFPFSDKKVFKIMKRFVINHTEIVHETKESYIKFSLKDDWPDIVPEHEEDGLEEDLFENYYDDTSDPTIH